jgi:hypothetical protein
LNNEKVAKRLPIDVRDALRAICTYGRGRCWYCDMKLPTAGRAIRAGWDVERVEQEPVSSIILVCPKCARQKVKLGEAEFQRRLARSTSSRRVRPQRLPAHA